MQFYTDHYFHIGSVHYASGKPCQDYALSGASEAAACAIVSDGCSTGRHTDIGSRIQALSLLGAMRSVDKSSGDLLELAHAISAAKKRLLSEAQTSLGLSGSDMLATSAYAYIGERGGFVHVEGDGAVVRKYRDGSMSMTLYEWHNNMPFYPTYDGLDLVQFVIAHGADLDAMRITERRISIAPDHAKSEVTLEHTLREGLCGIASVITEHELEEIEFVAVFTDGINQIEGVDWTVAAEEFMTFKTIEGEFAKRRMIRVLKGYERNGSKPKDDISIAVIRIAPLLPKEADVTRTEDEHQG